jgi:hypothetical protein
MYTQISVWLTGNVEDEEDVDRHHQDVGAEHRAKRAAPPAPELRPTDNDGCEHLKQHGACP